MATKYAIQQTGVSDGTKIPADKADGRQVGAKLSTIVASKKTTESWDNGDVVVLGTVRAGEHIRNVRVNSDTSFGAATVSIGTAAAPTKYVNAKTMTVTDVPTSIGPKASTADDGALAADEVIIATIGAANIGAAVVATIELEIASVK